MPSSRIAAAISAALLASALLGKSQGAGAISLPTQSQLVFTPNPRPLVIWHGLGDSAHSEGIDGFIEDIKLAHPGIFVYSVQIPLEGSMDDERKAGFWGIAGDQAEDGCDQIASIPEIAGGFDGMGFSQGGLFLRYYAQFCQGPPIRNLITFGTPHYGIAALIPCPSPPTLSCQLAARAARSGIYTGWAQTHLIQAQYYRDPARIDEFLVANTFIRDLNAEGDEDTDDENGTGGQGLGALENIVAVTFDADRTVEPALSAHWATRSPDNATEIIHLRDQPLYIEDWIGLRALDDAGKLVLEHCPGEHMDLSSGDCAKRMVETWVGWKV